MAFRSKAKQKQIDTNEGRCFACDQLGHLTDNCLLARVRTSKNSNKRQPALQQYKNQRR